MRYTNARQGAFSRVAKYLGTDHHEERLSSNLAANLIGDIGSWMDEPFSDPSLVPTYLLSRFTRKHVTVALGGDGQVTLVSPDAIEPLLEGLEKGDLVPVVAESFPFDRAAEAHRFIAERRNIGKVVLTP